jgi:hypothetical protein
MLLLGLLLLHNFGWAFLGLVFWFWLFRGLCFVLVVVVEGCF